MTPVFEGTAEAFAPWSGIATKFVSATPYFPNVHITQGKGRSERLKLGKVVIGSLNQIGSLTIDSPPTIHQIVAVGNTPMSVIVGCTEAALDTFPNSILFTPDRSLPLGGDFLMVAAKAENTIRPLDFCRRRNGASVTAIGRYLQIEFSTPQPRQPFALGDQAHFGLGLFTPVSS